MTQDFFTEITEYGETIINEQVLGGEKAFIANGWYIALGTGDLTPTKQTTSLVNPVYSKDSENYVGISFGTHKKYGRYAQIEIPHGLQGYLITEAGLFDDNDKLVAVAKTYADLRQTISKGLVYDYAIQIFLKTIPVNVDIVYVSQNELVNKDELDTAITDVTTNLQDYQNLNEKGQVNGYAPLDAEIKIPLEFLPEIEIPPQVNICIGDILSPLTKVNLLTAAEFAEKLPVGSELDCIEENFIDTNLSSYEVIAANTNYTYTYDGEYICDTTTVPTLTVIQNGNTRSIPSITRRIKAGTTFKSTLAGKFYALDGAN